MSEEKSVLIYIGAGLDLWPLRRLGHVYSEFQYVDAAPAKHQDCTPDQWGWEDTKDLPSMLAALRRDLEAEHAFAGIEDVTENVKRITTTSGLRLTYFFNLKDTEVAGAGMESYLHRVTGLYVAGYSPKVFPALPALQRVYLSSNMLQYHENGELAELPEGVDIVEMTETDFDMEPGRYIAHGVNETVLI